MKILLDISDKLLRSYIARADIRYWGEMVGETGDQDSLVDMKITVTEDEGEGPGGDGSWDLNEQTIANGLSVLARDFPNHFCDLLADNGDMHTGDILIQCAIFGEERYC